MNHPPGSSTAPPEPDPRNFKRVPSIAASIAASIVCVTAFGLPRGLVAPVATRCYSVLIRPPLMV